MGLCYWSPAGWTSAKYKIYPLTLPKQEAMENYTEEPHLSPTSPAAFHFTSSPNRMMVYVLVLIISLNNITVKFHYPHLLVPAALEQLCKAKIFSKLDLRTAYNLIRIRKGDEWKTTFVTPTDHIEYLVMPHGLVSAPSVHTVFRDLLNHFVLIYKWHSHSLQQPFKTSTTCHQSPSNFSVNTKLKSANSISQPFPFSDTLFPIMESLWTRGRWKPSVHCPSILHLQRFLGFANFYCRFIYNYSLIVQPFTSLLQSKPKTLSWNPDAGKAFCHFKELFCMAPLLSHPDPTQPFIVEVDASRTGVGVILS